MIRTFDYRKNLWFERWEDGSGKILHRDVKPTRQELDTLYEKATWNQPPYQEVCKE